MDGMEQIADIINAVFRAVRKRVYTEDETAFGSPVEMRFCAEPTYR
jgi:hypothetical protein